MLKAITIAGGTTDRAGREARAGHPHRPGRQPRHAAGQPAQGQDGARPRIRSCRRTTSSSFRSRSSDGRRSLERQSTCSTTGSILVRRRWVVYLSVSAVTLVALVGSFLITPLYRATADAADRAAEPGHPDLPRPRPGRLLLGRLLRLLPDPVQDHRQHGGGPQGRRAARAARATRSSPPRMRQPGLLARLKVAAPAQATAVPSRTAEDIAASAAAGRPRGRRRCATRTWCRSPGSRRTPSSPPRWPTRSPRPTSSSTSSRSTRPRTRPRSSWSTRSGQLKRRDRRDRGAAAGVRRVEADRLHRRHEQHHAAGAAGRSPSERTAAQTALAEAEAALRRRRAKRRPRRCPRC